MGGLRAPCLSVFLNVHQARARRFKVPRTKRNDPEDHAAIRIPQKLRNSRPNHIATRVNEGQKSRATTEAKVLQILHRQIANATADAGLKKRGSLSPDRRDFEPGAVNNGRPVARFFPQSHVLDIR
jgi:hypothetical protein